MSYRRGMSTGSAIRYGFGLAIGWTLARFVLGLLSAVTVGLWLATGRLHPVARWIVRGLLIALLALLVLIVLSEI